MSEKSKQILAIFNRAIPSLSDQEIDKLLAFGEGMVFMVNQRKSSPHEAEKPTTGKETA